MNMLRPFFFLFLLLSSAWPLVSTAQTRTHTAQTNTDSEVDLRTIAELDSMLQAFYNRLHYAERYDTLKLSYNTNAPVDVPRFPSDTIRERLKRIPAIMPMDYNSKVQTFIDVYTVRRRNLTSKLRGLEKVYFPMIEEVFYREGIPIEMKYLAVIESALNPKAVSSANAVGLWQFMLPTGKMYGLEVNSLIDERMDPYKSTVAAAKYLKDLYGMYHDWQLAIAAYNCGPGRVNYAIRRSGQRNFWKLWHLLPRETASYVPTFIAATYAMHYAEQHDIFPVNVNFTYHQDTLEFCRTQISLQDLAATAGCDVEYLARLNPELRRGLVPYQAVPYSVRVPLQVAEHYRRGGMDSLMKRIVETRQEISERKSIRHTVKRGESPESIAKRYEVPGDSVRIWNRIRGEYVHPGQVLKLYVHPDLATAMAPAPKSSSKVAAAKTKKRTPAPNGNYHRVEQGDSLWTIANKYKTSVDNLVVINNISRTTVLRIGQVIQLAN